MELQTVQQSFVCAKLVHPLSRNRWLPLAPFEASVEDKVNVPTKRSVTWKFDDLPDYILGITKEIWEDRGVDTLRHYYAPNIAVRSPLSVSTR